MKTLLTGLLLLPLSAMAQVSEDFERKYFIQPPSWTGDTVQWALTGSQLQSNSVTPNSSFYLSTPSFLALNTQWEFYVQLKFNTSSLNYADIYLTADSSDLTAPSNRGYFIRIGNTPDEASLYRKDSGAVMLKIIDGTDGLTNHAGNMLKIKVTRDAQNKWSLFTDNTGSGAHYLPEGSYTDSTYTTSSWFGILVRQSTASFFQKHLFDDIAVRPLVIDLDPPMILEVKAGDSNRVDIQFSEPVETVSGEDPSAYFTDNHIGYADSCKISAADKSRVQVWFSKAFISGADYKLTVAGIKDLSGNLLTRAEASFSYYIPGPYDVIIDEIFANPTASPALPAYEFIELKNNTSYPFNLSGWQFGNNVRTATLDDFILAPDSFLILCTKNAMPAYQSWGHTMGVTNFPALKNDGDTLLLQTGEGKLIHAVIYNNKWYGDEMKSRGGWSLEMADTRYPCAGMSAGVPAGNNWKAAIDPKGGTPGSRNSVSGNYLDDSPPDLLRAHLSDSTTLQLVFNKSLDIAAASLPRNYHIDNDMGLPLAVSLNSPQFNTVTLQLAAPAEGGKAYTVTVQDIRDCMGNGIGLKNTARFGMVEKTDSFDVVINEVLFNPPAGGKEFVELYNRSRKILDLQTLRLANRDKNGVIASQKIIAGGARLFFPGEYLVITADAQTLQQQYFCKNPEALLEIPVLPSYPNQSGTVVLVSEEGKIVDEFNYHENYHHSLITDPKGISLERLDVNAAAMNAQNWHSAAAEAGYATPTYQNSQWTGENELKGTVTVQPEVFSPDHDGRDDLAYMQYEFPEAGYMANITIFDANGRPVRYLAKNTLLSNRGKFTWDGLNENKRSLRSGIYVIYFEAFTLEGKVKKFKKTVVLAGKF